MGEGLDLNALIGVVGAGWHSGKSFNIDVCPTDGTATSGCILFVCVQHCMRYKINLYI